MRLITWAIILGLSALPVFALSTCARAADCPPNIPACKVLTLTPDEERVLTAPNGVLDTAQQGRALELTQIVNYFRQKIAAAPAGNVKKPEVPPVATPDAGAKP